MKDIKASMFDGKFNDIVFTVVPVVIGQLPNGAQETVRVQQLVVVEGYDKLSQSLTKLFVEDATYSPIGFGVYPQTFSTDEISRAIGYFNGVNESSDPDEIIASVDKIDQVTSDTYEVVVTTQSGQEASLTVGV